MPGAEHVACQPVIQRDEEAGVQHGHERLAVVFSVAPKGLLLSNRSPAVDSIGISKHGPGEAPTWFRLPIGKGYGPSPQVMRIEPEAGAVQPLKRS